jgi:hypothetical protein
VVSPSDGSEVHTAIPALEVAPAGDPDGDPVSYGFELYSDSELTVPVASRTEIAPDTGGRVVWTPPIVLVENGAYWWRARAFDGQIHGPWTSVASFRVNVVNDAPSAPVPVEPSPGGSIATDAPSLIVQNASDPEADPLTYTFEVYGGPALADLLASAASVTEGAGVTAWTVTPPLPADGVYAWRARAFDGAQFGSWMPTVTFQIHRPVNAISVQLEIKPETLNRRSRGSWIMAKIEFPHGYDARHVEVASLRLNGTVPAELQPVAFCEDRHGRSHEHDDDGDDEDEDSCRELKVKFDRARVQATLSPGDNVRITVTGRLGVLIFEGVDEIRVAP